MNLGKFIQETGGIFAKNTEEGSFRFRLKDGGFEHFWETFSRQEAHAAAVRCLHTA
jgi:hypothetical protein